MIKEIIVGVGKCSKMQDKRIDDYIVSKTNITQDQLDKSKLQCWWFDYDEAIKLGVVNK